MFAQRMWGFGGNGFGNGFGGGFGNGVQGLDTGLALSNGLQSAEIQSQLSNIREQLNTNQNTSLLMDAIKGNGSAVNQLAGQLNCDFNTLNSAICDVRGGVDKVAGQVGFSAERVINAISSGDAGLANQLSTCCCNIREAVTKGNYENQLATVNQTNVLESAITRQGYENQLGNVNQTNVLQSAINKQGCDNQLATVNQTNTLQNAINFVNSSVERGFAATNFETAQQTCAITKAIADSTAQILAGQKAAEMREMQREIQNLRDERTQFQMSALSQAQTQTIVNQIKPCPIPAYITCNPYSGNYPYNGYGYNTYSDGGCGCN